MKEQEKFECDDCGCYFWVNDRNSFECPEELKGQLKIGDFFG